MRGLWDGSGGVGVLTSVLYNTQHELRDTVTDLCAYRLMYIIPTVHSLTRACLFHSQLELSYPVSSGLCIENPPLFGPTSAKRDCGYPPDNSRAATATQSWGISQARPIFRAHPSTSPVQLLHCLSSLRVWYASCFLRSRSLIAIGRARLPSLLFISRPIPTVLDRS